MEGMAISLHPSLDLITQAIPCAKLLRVAPKAS
jgi:hypothetical protein